MNYRRPFPFVSGKFVPTCVVRKRIKRGNYVHLNNKEVSKVFLRSHFLISTCAKSVLLLYGTFMLIYAIHFWDRTYRNIILSDNRCESFPMNSLGLQSFLMYNKRDSLSRKITAPSWNVTNKNLISTAILLNWNAWTPAHGKFLLSREMVCAKSDTGCRMKGCTRGRLKYFEMWCCMFGWWLPTFRSLCLHLQEEAFKDKLLRLLNLEDQGN